MNPHLYPGQPASRPDSSAGEEGVNYLRRLKGTTAEGAPPAATKDGSAVPATAGAVDWKERRQSPRLRCSGSVEFRTDGNDVRLWGTLTDVSMHGCYVEMNTTFPVGTKVDLVLKSFGIAIRATGEVRASYPFLGMGIGFAHVEPEQRLQLKQLLDALAGQSAVSNRKPPPEKSAKDTLAAADPAALINGIAEFFQKHQLLSRDEFHKIAKRVRRS